MDMTFTIGAPIFTTDGHAGKLDKIVVDPNTHRGTHLILHGGLLRTEDRVIPVELVERATPEGIYLRLTGRELANQPLYNEYEFVTLPPEIEPPLGYVPQDVLLWGPPYVGMMPPYVPAVEHVIHLGVPSGEIILGRGVEGRADGEVVGEIDHLLLDPTRKEITHLIVKLFDAPQSVIVPFDWVEEVGDGYVNLKRSSEVLSALQPYPQPSDDAIAAAVQDALRRECGDACRGIRLQVDRGFVRLTGTVPDETVKAEAGRIARAVPGVTGGKNELLLDATVVEHVVEALHRDPRTTEAHIAVNSVEGIVTLRGEVESGAVKGAAAKVAEQVPGVEWVVDELTVLPFETIVEGEFKYDKGD